MLVIRQCNRTVKGTINTSCLCKWTGRVIARAVVSHFVELFFLMKTCNSYIVSFSNSVIVLIKL